VNVIAAGRREEGKDTLMLWHAKQRHAGVVIFDQRGLYSGIHCWNADELEEAISEQDWRKDILVYRFDTADVEAEFEGVCEVLFPPRMTRGGFALIISEAGDLQSANSINPALKRALGQHKTRPHEQEVTIYQASHRMAEFHGKSKALIDELYIFNTQHPRDLEAIIEYTQDPEVAAVVSQLPKHHVVRVVMARQDGRKQWEVWSDPKVWFVPIGKEATQDAEGTNPGGKRLEGCSGAVRARPGGRGYPQSGIGSPGSA